MRGVPSPDPGGTFQDFASALIPGEDGFDREKLLRIADAARLEMEELAAEIRNLVLAQPPIQLLGFVMGHFHMAMMMPASEQADSHPNKETIKDFQLALEYLHAVWSCHAPTVAETAPLDEVKAGELFSTSNSCRTLLGATAWPTRPAIRRANQAWPTWSSTPSRHGR